MAAGDDGRNVRLLGGTLFVVGMGEELWQAFLPAYLRAIGASGVVVGLFASYRDFLDCAYQFPGGWIADRVGVRRTMIACLALAVVGYALYAAAPMVAAAFVAVTATMAWKAGAFPLTFTIVGDALPPDRRIVAFGVQSILVRIPRVIGAPAGGAAIAALGVSLGFRLGAAITAIVAAAMVAINWRWFTDVSSRATAADGRRARQVVMRLPPSLRALLVADVLVRVGEGIAAAFIVLYVLEVLGIPATIYGGLYALQQLVSIASYVPSLRAGRDANRRALIAVTFVSFAAFPLLVRMSRGIPALVAAFTVGGLKEIGEPARKALIVDLAPAGQRGRTVGAYYAVRNVFVVAAGSIGGVLWQQSRVLPLEVGAAVGVVGVVAYLIAVWRLGLGGPAMQKV